MDQKSRLIVRKLLLIVLITSTPCVTLIKPVPKFPYLETGTVILIGAYSQEYSEDARVRNTLSFKHSWWLAIYSQNDTGK